MRSAYWALCDRNCQHWTSFPETSRAPSSGILLSLSFALFRLLVSGPPSCSQVEDIIIANMSSTDASRSRYPRQFRLPARWTRKPKKDRQHPPVPRSEQFWACSNCGHAGMSVFIDSCPECQHLRCETCSLETVEIRRRSGEPGFASRTSNTRDLGSTKSTPTTPDTLASSSLEYAGPIF